MEIKFIKTHPKAKLPRYSYKGEDAGLDVFAVETIKIPGLISALISYIKKLFGKEVVHNSAVIPIGLTLAYITPGFWLKVETRSGLGFKWHLHTHHGIIDNGYREDLGIKIYNFSLFDYTVKEGDKIAQLVPYKLYIAKVSFTNEISESKRGGNGFGSTGK